MKPTSALLKEAIESLKTKRPEVAVKVMEDEYLEIEYFSPIKVDTQQPHTRDELYIVVRGHGKLNREGERTECQAGDLLYVPAGMQHRFEEFSDDLACWVIFYGPVK